jgi:small subunit ribosomal protein S1
MSDNKVEKPEDVVKPGQKLELRVLNVDPAERKIGLSLRTNPGTGIAQIEAEGKTADIEAKKEDEVVKKPEAKKAEEPEAKKPEAKKAE